MSSTASSTCRNLSKSPSFFLLTHIHTSNINCFLTVINTVLTKSCGICLNQNSRDRYSTSRVSKRFTDERAAQQSRAVLYCRPNVAGFDSGQMPGNFVNAVINDPSMPGANFYQETSDWENDERCC